MENEKKGEEPKMLVSKEEKDETDEVFDKESREQNMVKNEANAIKRAIKSLDWRHEIQNQNILKLISSSKNNERNKREIINEAEIYQKRFKRLDENYSRLYQLLEGDPSAGERHINEWERLIEKEREIRNLIEDKLENYQQEEEPDGATCNIEKDTKREKETIETEKGM